MLYEFDKRFPPSSVDSTSVVVTKPGYRVVTSPFSDVYDDANQIPKKYYVFDDVITF